MSVFEPSVVSGLIVRLSRSWTYRLFSRTNATRLPSGDSVANISDDGAASPPSLLSLRAPTSSSQ